MKVFSYRNLNRKGIVWSLKCWKTKLVIDRRTLVKFKDAELKVSQAGRRRVLKEKRKNVHAGVQGTVMQRLPANLKWEKAYYNPYETKTFVDSKGKELKFVKYAKLCNTGLWVVR
mgnify:CR=1 FL=1